MSSRDERDHLRDILRSIDLIRSFIDGFSFEAYLQDRKTQAAVERELSIISEAGHLA